LPDAMASLDRRRITYGYGIEEVRNGCLYLCACQREKVLLNLL